VVEVKTGSRSTTHWSNHFIRLSGWLRNSFAQLISPLDIDGIGQNWEDSNNWLNTQSWPDRPVSLRDCAREVVRPAPQSQKHTRAPRIVPRTSRLLCGGGRFRSWKGRGLLAVDSTPPRSAPRCWIHHEPRFPPNRSKALVRNGLELAR